MAADAPEITHSLTLIEPPPVHTRSAPEFRAANHRLMQTRRQQGSAAALEEFLSLVIGPDWHEVVEEQLPGSTAQMRRDTATFFDADLGLCSRRPPFRASSQRSVSENDRVRIAQRAPSG